MFKALRISGTVVLGLWRNQCVNTSRPPIGPDEVKWNVSCVNTALTFSISTLLKACRQLFSTINTPSFCAFKMSFCKCLQRRKIGAMLWHGLRTSSERGAAQVAIGTLTSFQEIKFEHRSVQKNSTAASSYDNFISFLPGVLLVLHKWCPAAFIDLIVIVFHCLCRYVCHVTLAEDHCCRKLLQKKHNNQKKIVMFLEAYDAFACAYIHTSGKLRTCR